MAVHSSESSEELQQKVSNLKQSVSEKALEMVHKTMPTKLLELSELFQSHPSLNKPSSEVRILKGLDLDVLQKEKSQQANKKRKLTEGGEQAMDGITSDIAVPTNPLIDDLVNIIKSRIMELIEIINTVKVWIQLNIPRIEDGNNFGVSIQEETVNELGRAEDSGFTVLESVTKYYVTRAKIVTKVIKHPHVADYRQSVIELDEKEFINLKLCLMDLRNNYAILYDMIIKNLEKLQKPRSSNHMASIY